MPELPEVETTIRYLGKKVNGKKITFHFNHLVSSDEIIIEQDLALKSKKVKNFKDYDSFLKSNNIVLDHNEREKIILKKINSTSKSKDYKEKFDICVGNPPYGVKNDIKYDGDYWPKFMKCGCSI